MRRLFLCVSLIFVFAILGSQLALAQNGGGGASQLAGAPSGGVRYSDVNYQTYQQGVVVSSSNTIRGVLLGDAQGSGTPISGKKLTILGGDEFVAEVVTNQNGAFVFENAYAGSYTILMDNGTAVSSVDFKVTGNEPNVASLAPNTGVNNWLVLTVDENGMLRFAATRGSLPMPLATTPAGTAATAAGGGMAAGGMAGGGMGGFAGALGIAGLAGGIAALATSDNGGGSGKPVSTGAPVAR